MLTTKQAITIGRRGGQARARNLPPEKRRDLASWAWRIREQKRRGEPTDAEQRHKLVELVRAEDPELAALLDFLPRLPVKRAEEIYRTVSDEQRQLVERKFDEVLRA